MAGAAVSGPAGNTVCTRACTRACTQADTRVCTRACTRACTKVRSAQRGVTLVELVVVLTVMAVMASIGATLVGRIVSGQQDNRARLVLALQSDVALAQLSDALSAALPNSLRLSSNVDGVWVEWVPILEAGRYRQAPDTVGPDAGDPLDLDNAADNSFDVIGRAMPASVVGRELVFGNLGQPEADAYVGNNRRAGIALSNAGSRIAFTAAGALPAQGGQGRFFVVGTPVTVACVAQAGGGFELVRYSGYGWLSAQPSSLAALAAATPVRQLVGLRGCSASYSTALANIGMLSLRLQAGSVGGSTQMDLMHPVAVDNTP